MTANYAILTAFLAIAIFGAMESSSAEWTDGLQDIYGDYIILNHYTISMDSDQRVAVMYLENTDTRANRLSGWKVSVSENIRNLGNYTLEPGEKIPIVLLIDNNIAEGEAITVTNNDGKVVQSIPLPQIIEDDICDGYRGAGGVWKINFDSYTVA